MLHRFTIRLKVGEESYSNIGIFQSLQLPLVGSMVSTEDHNPIVGTVRGVYHKVYPIGSQIEPEAMDMPYVLVEPVNSLR